MAPSLRPLWRLPLFQQQRSCKLDTIHKHAQPSLKEEVPQLFPFGILLSVRNCSFVKRTNIHALTPSGVVLEENSELESEIFKSRNQKKREARRAVRWGMELASFSPNQIKRILKVTSLEQDVYDALMLAKKFGPDIREGKRRQFNYIGKLLREVEPDLMDALILSTKDGNWSRINTISDVKVENPTEKNDEDDEFDELEEDDETCLETAKRWMDGIINNDVQVSKEIYAIQNADFDRKELRKLVRKTQELQQRNITDEDKQEVESALSIATKSLNRFLLRLATQSKVDPLF